MIKSIDGGKYNSMLAQALKKEGHFTMPEWVEFVKTGAGKVRPHSEPDFWEKRAASILRQIYINEVVGVERLRTRYGNRKKRGARPNRFYKSSGKMIRLILQQAEEAGLVEKATTGKAGRKLTVKGKMFLESVAK